MANKRFNSQVTTLKQPKSGQGAPTSVGAGSPNDVRDGVAPVVAEPAGEVGAGSIERECLKKRFTPSRRACAVARTVADGDE
jgi:hypothetical protein